MEVKDCAIQQMLREYATAKAGLIFKLRMTMGLSCIPNDPAFALSVLSELRAAQHGYQNALDELDRHLEEHQCDTL